MWIRIQESIKYKNIFFQFCDMGYTTELQDTGSILEIQLVFKFGIPGSNNKYLILILNRES